MPSSAAVEEDGAGEFLAEEGIVSTSARSSLHTSSSTSESLRMMMMSLPSGPRRPRLRSPKSLRVISSSCEVMGVTSSSSKDKSTTGNPTEGSPCSYIRDGGPWDEPSSEEATEDAIGDDSGVDALLDEDEDMLA
jgi:hypothetical protein